MLNFDFLEEGLGIFSSTHFVYDIFRKMFLTLDSINWPNFIAWLPLLLEIFVKLCIAIACFPGCDVVNFEINLIFLIKAFLYKTKKSLQKFKYLENEKSFKGDIKSIFHHFQRVFKNSLRPESAPLNLWCFKQAQTCSNSSSSMNGDFWYVNLYKLGVRKKLVFLKINVSIFSLLGPVTLRLLFCSIQLKMSSKMSFSKFFEHMSSNDTAG